ncbi:MAG: hypothetical protein ACR2MD_01075 [Aridibacter sp.]
MAILTRQAAMISDTDANFRAWAKFISDGFALSFTNVFTNIDFLAVVKPTVINTVSGKEIWSSNDSGSGLNNFFVLVEYGSAAAVTTPSIWVTIGWTHDGLGALTGVTTTRQQFLLSGSATTLRNCYASGDAGRVRMALGEAIGQSWAINIERLKENAAFVNKANITMTYTATGVFNQTSKSDVAYPSTLSGTLFTMMPFSATLTNIQDTVVGLGWHYPYSSGWGNRLTGFLMVPDGQLSAPGTTVIINFNGTDKTFMVLTAVAGLNLRALASYNGLMLYE